MTFAWIYPEGSITNLCFGLSIFIIFTCQSQNAITPAGTRCFSNSNTQWHRLTSRWHWRKVHGKSLMFFECRNMDLKTYTLFLISSQGLLIPSEIEREKQSGKEGHSMCCCWIMTYLLTLDCFVCIFDVLLQWIKFKNKATLYFTIFYDNLSCVILVSM